MSSQRKVCWDADVFITILKGRDPDRSNEELVALREAVTAFDTGQLIVVVPATIYTEVLDPIDDEELGRRFESMLRRSNLVEQDITKELSRVAGRMRKELRDGGRSLRTPDSQYVAAALIHKCDALHTFDGKLHRLSGDEVVKGLRIIKPQVEQTELGLG
jgi:predicted nucleic acid-binding protein